MVEVWKQRKDLGIQILKSLFKALFSLPWTLFDICVLTIFPLSAGFTSDRPAHRIPPRVHINRISSIANNLRNAIKAGRKVTAGKTHGNGHSSRSNLFKRQTTRLDTSYLNNIIDLDIGRKQATVEANVSFAALVAATLAHNLLPVVVPEFKTISVGGAVQGLGIESTSFLHGTFDQSVLDADLLVPKSGAIVAAVVKKHQHPDLWAATVGSNGSVSILLNATIRLVPATRWVCLRYVRYASIKAFMAEVETKCAGMQEKAGWVGDDVLCDAIVFAPNCVIAMFGGCSPDVHADRRRGVPVYRNHSAQPFFFEHVQAISRQKRLVGRKSTVEHGGELIHEELWSTSEYLFRYDRGGFWGVHQLAKMIPPIKWMLAAPLLRPLFHTFLSTTTLYKIALLLSDQHRESLVMLQDVTLPFDDDCRAVNDLCGWLGITPLWLCPVRCAPKEQHKRLFALDGRKGQSIMLNIGLYGQPTNLKQDLVTTNRQLEEKVAEAGGHKALYAFVYSDRRDFWQHLDQEQYDKVSARYGSDRTFVNLYDKVAYCKQV